MQQEVWSREDLKNAILATYYAGVVAPSGVGGAGGQRYAEGFRAALTSLAIYIGLPPAVLPQAKPPLPDGEAGVRLIGK